MGIRHHVAVVSLLLIFAFQCLTSLKHKAPTFDEVLFVPSGYAFLRTGSTLTNPEAQPLPRILSAFPLLLVKPQLSPEEPAFQKRYEWGSNFLFQYNRSRTEQIVFWPRIPVILLGLSLLYIVYLWSRKLFGAAASLIALAFASTDPNLIAHSSLATSDLPFTLFFVLTLYLFCSKPRDSQNIFLIGGTFAAALLCKSTAWLLIPLFFLILLASRPPEFLQHVLKTCAIILFGLLIVNVVFLFHGTFHDKGQMMKTLGISGHLFPRIITYFLPDQYSFAFLYNLAESSGGQHPFPFFLHGNYSFTGFWNYFFVALLIKTPLSVLIWTILTIFFLWKNSDRRTAMLLTIPWIFVLFYFSFVNKLNLGLRHILPIFPLWYVAAGAPLLLVAENRKRLLTSIAACALLWSAITAVRIHPHQLAYFNELIGGPENGYQYLVDSNVDWGQDLAKLKDYMQKQNLERVSLSYFGTADPLHYGIEYDYLPSPRFEPWTLRHFDDGRFALKKGVYAISATNLQGVYLRDHRTYAIFQNRKPDDFVGYSILIYRY